VETLLTGTFVKGGPWGGKPDKPGGMIRAFYDKDEEFKNALKSNDPDLQRLTAERDGERNAVVAWIKTAEDVRKKAFEDDAFVLPPELAGKPLTAAFKANDTTVKVRTLFTARCTVCHGPNGEKEDIPLTKYDEIAKYLRPADGAKADGAVPKAKD
jgi:hypothetical protein